MTCLRYEDVPPVGGDILFPIPKHTPLAEARFIVGFVKVAHFDNPAGGRRSPVPGGVKVTSSTNALLLSLLTFTALSPGIGMIIRFSFSGGSFAGV